MRMIKNTASTTYDRRFLKIAKTCTVIQALEYILLKYFEEAPLNISLLILSPVLVSNDLRILLTETDIARSKSFLRSFIQKIVIHGDRGTIYSKLPVPTSWKETEDIVLPIVPFGGAEGIRTPYLLVANEALSQLSYSPTKENIEYLSSKS